MSRAAAATPRRSAAARAVAVNPTEAQRPESAAAAPVLEELRIRGLGVIEDAVLDLGLGLTVLTGETGVGKTMVVTGLGLLLGARADTGTLRAGTEQASVEGLLLLPPGSDELRRRVAEAGGQVGEDGELVAARTVSAEGRSRAYLAGRSVPVALLAEIGGALVAVHGQSDQQRLLAPALQRAALDRYAGAALSEPLAGYQRDYAQLREVVAELAEVRNNRAERARELDLLSFGLDEIAAVAPAAGEDHALREEEDRLGHVENLRQAAAAAHRLLAGEAEDAETSPDAVTLLARAARELTGPARHDPALHGLAERLEETSYLLADLATDLSGYLRGLDADPHRLAAVAERRAQLARLTRKYGEDVDAVLAWAQAAQARVADLSGDEDRLEELQAREAELLERLARAGEQVSAARGAAAGRLADQVGAELRQLAMPAARLHVAVEQREQPDGLPVGGRRVAFGPDGVDEVEFRLAAHAGAPQRPLARGASGGELSRVMLAVEVVLAGVAPVPVFVFDEVDAGVGGKAAVEVGRRLARLAATAQVLVVTHLPQVAAYADRHLVVRKVEGGPVTSTDVLRLDEPGRVRELARMLAGQEDSATAAAHASELLATAAAEKGR